ncbi:sugar ABC transporter substrate-binding protein [Streptomyces sp. NBC_01142]|uniref:sugar ABC transporter substrate-binding protein n=1 Tax=Streptomyces sp. NBC_01142 TaxID=2975865 RepID=UPI0022550201|nr:sugar ABC transporter substrate-binding protein [Streptomyces sp. NBC_01142]MCX4825761.1 sugar ABC transporter substrate-binding protein [Streptomyces sp. NBC_01142]
MPTGRRRRAICLSVTLALPVGALAACGGGSTSGVEAGDGRGSISVWAHQGQDSENKALQNAVAAFNRTQSEVKAGLKLIPGNDYTKTITAAAPSELPDVMEFDGPNMANFVYNEKLAPLNDFVPKGTVANATKAIAQQGTVGDDLYGLAMYDSGLGLYGNKKLLDAAGVDYPKSAGEAWTADEFSAALTKLAAKDPDRKVLDLQEANGMATEWGTYGFSPVLWSAGGRLVGDDGKASGSLDSDAAVAGLKTFQSWKPLVDPNTDGNAMAERKVALSWVGHWMYPAYDKALGKDLVVMPLPDFGKGPKTGQGSWAWGIGSDTKNGKAAGKFLEFLLNDDNVTAMTEANGAPPATESALAKSRLYGENGPLQLFAEQLSVPCGVNRITPTCVATTRPVTAGYPVVTGEFSKALNAIYGGADPKAELSKAARAIDRDFADNDGYAY